MPHDKNGTLLNIGDEVILRCKIINVSVGETACNITAEALERPNGEDYIPQIAGNSRFYELIEAAEKGKGFTPIDEGIPPGFIIPA